MFYRSSIKIFIEFCAFIALKFQFTEVICQYFNTFALPIEIKNKINFFSYLHYANLHIFPEKSRIYNAGLAHYPS